MAEAKQIRWQDHYKVWHGVMMGQPIFLIECDSFAGECVWPMPDSMQGGGFFVKVGEDIVIDGVSNRNFQLGEYAGILTIDTTWERRPDEEPQWLVTKVVRLDDRVIYRAEVPTYRADPPDESGEQTHYGGDD